jgi:hypothetical protein
MAEAPASGPPSTGVGRERRRHARAITNFTAELEAGGIRYVTRVVNLSMGGALLDFQGFPPTATVAVGERVGVNVRCRGAHLPAIVQGTVVMWNLQRGTEPLLAIQFQEVSDDAAEILEDLLAEALMDLGRRSVSKRILGKR